MQNYFRTRTLGENKRARTRGVLIDSAIDVFAAKGIEDASIQEITAVAGMANGTFYNHFKDKDDLAVATAEAIALELAKTLDANMQDLERGVSRVVVASWAFLRLALASDAWARVLYEQYQRRMSAKSAVFRYMRADVDLAVAQNQVDVVVDVFLFDQLAALMMAALRHMLFAGTDDVLLQRMCENQLRVLGLTPAQAKREVAKVTNHPMLLASGQASTLLPETAGLPVEMRS